MSDTSRLNLDLLPTECFHLIAQNYSLEGLIELAKNPAAPSAQDPILFSHGKRHLGEDSNYALAPRPRLLQPNEKEAIRAGALQVIDEHLQLLVQNNVRLMGKPGHDEPYLILEKTLQEQKREITALQINENNSISAAQKFQLATAASIKGTYIGDLIAIDTLLNEVNMTLMHPDLDDYESAPEEQQRYLNLDGLGLTRLPEELIIKLKRYPVLNLLNLSDNQLSTLPDSFGDLVMLTRLFAQNNKLTTLPNSFGNLVMLTRLFAQNNKLTTLPNSFGNLVRLIRLFLSSNPFTTLPESIRQILIKTYNGRFLSLLTSEPVHMDESDGDISAAAATYTPSATKKQGKKRKAAKETISPQNSDIAGEEKLRKKEQNKN